MQLGPRGSERERERERERGNMEKENNCEWSGTYKISTEGLDC